MSAILLGIIIAGSIVAVPAAVFLFVHYASREEPTVAPVPPPQSGWGSIHPSAPAAPPPMAYPQNRQTPSSWPAPVTTSIATSQQTSESPSPATVVGNIIRNLAGPNLDSLAVLAQLSAQVEAENRDRNLTRAERQQKLIAALDELAARDPGNESVQRLRDSIRRAASGMPS